MSQTLWLVTIFHVRSSVEAKMIFLILAYLKHSVRMTPCSPRIQGVVHTMETVVDRGVDFMSILGVSKNKMNC